MTDTQLTDVTVVPEDRGTKGDETAERDDVNAAHVATQVSARGTASYIERGLVPTVDGTIPAGTAFIRQEGGTQTYDEASGSFSAWDSAGFFTVELHSDETGLTFDSDADNDVYLAIDLSTADGDGAYVRHGSSVSPPPDPSVKLGVVDTAAGVVTPSDAAQGPVGEYRSVDTGVVSDRTYHADDGPDIQPTIDAARSAGGGEVVLPSGVSLIDDTIDVWEGVTLRLPNGCVIEPSSVFDMVHLRRDDASNRQEPGRIVGNGMLRTRPSDLARSAITSFDGAAHVIVDGTDDFRPKDPVDAQNTRLVDGINIWAETSTTGGYGIYLRCTNDDANCFVWFQRFRAHIRGCDDAIRLEADVSNPDFDATATINSNRFDVFAYWPITAVNEVRQTPYVNDNNTKANEYNIFANCHPDSTTFYRLEGQEAHLWGFDWDTQRPATFLSFGADSDHNWAEVGRRTADATIVNDGAASNRVTFPYRTPDSGGPIDHDRTSWRAEQSDARYIALDDDARTLTPQLPVMRTFGAPVSDVPGWTVAGDAANTAVVSGLETTAGAQVRSPPGYSGTAMEIEFSDFATLTADGAELAWWVTRGDDIAAADGQVHCRVRSSADDNVTDIRLLHDGSVSVRTGSSGTVIGSYDNATPQFFRCSFDFTNSEVTVFRNGADEGTFAMETAAADVDYLKAHLYDDRTPAVDQPTAILEDIRTS